MKSVSVASIPTRPARPARHHAVFVLPGRDGNASVRWVAALPRTGNKGKLADAGAQDKVMFHRHEQPCAAQARATNRTANVRHEVRTTQLMVDAACQEKRAVRVDRRPRVASLGSEDRKAFAPVESDVARGCR